MSGNQITSVAVGIVGGVIGFFVGGVQGAMLGFSLAYGLTAAVLGPDAPKQGTLRPDELQMSQSSESATVPVIFGTVRLAGNYMAYDKANFVAEEVYAEEEGGKGGGGGDQQQTGWKYFLTWDLGLCMGQVDQLRAVQGSPGMDPLTFSNMTSLDGAGQATFTFAGTPNSGDTVNIGSVVYTFRTVATLPYEIPIDGVLGLFSSYGLVNAINGGLPGTPAHPDVFARSSDIGKVTISARQTGSTGNGIVLSTSVSGSWDNAATTGGTEPINLTSSATTLALKSSKEDGGSIIFFRGDNTQVSPGAIDGIAPNYRGVCYVRFVQFNLGGSAAPRSYLFEVQRMPKVLDAEGNTIAGFQTRAALDDTVSEWNDANPAAIIWEFMTNTEWGKGIHPSAINVDDFKRAASHFAQTRMGISTALGDDTSLADQVNRIRDLFGLVTWWDGNQTRCVCIYDRSNAYSPRRRILPEDTIGDVQFSRNSMSSTSNEIRLEFTNRENGWQKEAASAMDLANVETIGGVRSQKIDGAEIGTRRTAEILSHRMLKAMAYPPAMAEVNVRRSFSDLQPGSFVELLVDSWRGDIMTTFWRLDRIEDDGSGEGELKLYLVEDIYATGLDGEIVDFTAPIPTSDFDDPLTNQDLVVIDYQRPLMLDAITPILVDEPNIWVSGAERRVLVAAHRRAKSIQSFSVAFKESALGNFQSLGVLQGFAITGITLDAVPAGGLKTFRKAPDQFRLALHTPELDAADLLASASSVQLDSDGMDLLTAEGSALLIIGREVIRCGHIEQTGTNEFTVRVAMRCEFGTDQAAHAQGSTFHFLKFFHRSKLTAAAPSLPIGVPVDVSVTPNATTGFGEATIVQGPVSGGFDGNSFRPLRPELYTATRVGTTWTIKLRPRIYNGGSNYNPTLEADLLAREADVGFHRINLERTGAPVLALPEYMESGSIGTAAMTVTRFVFIPTDGTSRETGLWELVVQFDVNPTTLTIRGLLSGQTSDPLLIPQPAL